jgi:gamma-glutamyl-gamma-aminobutyrate hydrolase PuuD
VITEKNIDEIKAPGILALWGGGDIHPMMYNRTNQGSYIQGEVPSYRDQIEAKMFAQAYKEGVFIFGVCRGAQLGCAMSGGILVQHVENHHHDHLVSTIDGDRFIASSLHHQMMYPWDIKHKLFAWSTSAKSPRYDGITEEEWEKWPRKIYDELKTEDVIEPEIVYFPVTKCLAVQGHPEMMAANTKHNLYIRKLIDELYVHVHTV